MLLKHHFAFLGFRDIDDTDAAVIDIDTNSSPNDTFKKVFHEISHDSLYKVFCLNYENF